MPHRCVLLVAFALIGCGRRPQVVKVFPTSPPAVVWEVGKPCPTFELDSVSRVYPWLTSRVRCALRARSTCTLLTFDETHPPSPDCLGGIALSGGGRWSAIAFEGGTRFYEESTKGLVVDASGAGVRFIVVDPTDAGVPSAPFDDLVVGVLWSKPDDELLERFEALGSASRVLALKITTPSLTPLYGDLFAMLTPEEQRELGDWQLERALPTDGRLPESSILLFLLEHPEVWPADFSQRVTRAWKADVARPVLVTHAAWFGVTEAETALCAQLGRAIAGPLGTHAPDDDLDPLVLAVIAERKLQCEWVAEVVRQRLPKLLECDTCDLAHAREAVRATLDAHRQPSFERDLLLTDGEPTLGVELSLAALAVQRDVPSDVTSRLARLRATFVGEPSCLEAKTKVLVRSLPPEVHQFTDDWGCAFSLDDARGVITVTRRKVLK